MIGLDSSAVVALILEEPGIERVLPAFAAADGFVMGAPTYVECRMVLTGRLGDRGAALLEEFLARNAVTVLPFSPAHARAAGDAFDRYGKGRDPARLNFGDCMSYAVAQVEELPLLYVGDDFARTDVAGALGFNSGSGTGQ